MIEAVFSPSLLAGRRAIVTGGGTGIGFAIASALSRLGAHVMICARTAERLEAAVSEIRDAGGAAEPHRLDIRDGNAVTKAFEGPLAGCDCLVNNAGGQFPAKALDISANGFRAVMDLNVQGTWHMTRAFALDRVARGGGGRIVNIVFSHTGAMAWFAHGQAARSAVMNLTQTLALEWGPHDITVNAVGPGPIRTDAVKAYSEGMGWSDLSHELPAGRRGEAEEVAALVAFLLSPAAGYITGALIPIDGGEALMIGPRAATRVKKDGAQNEH